MLTIISIFLFLILTLFGYLYYHSKTRSKFFIKQNINFIQPSPLYGNLTEPITKKVTYADHYKKIYDSFPKDTVVGMFEFFNQVYMIKDPELIKQIQIKEFDSFVNHRVVIGHETDPIFGRNLLLIKDQQWREKRSILSPAFTGAKMRFMFELIRECAQNGIDFIANEAKSNDGVYEFEAKDFFGRCANDVIATSAFGFEVNSIKDKENAFYKNATVLHDFNGIYALKFLLAVSAPKILQTLGLKVLNESATNYFKNTVLEAMRYRENQNSTRPDMIQLLIQAKNKGLMDDEDDFVAQCLVFFLAGFGTSSTLFSFLSYELARNQEIQDRLREEIDNFVQELGGKNPSYEDISKLKYMEMVMNETLRLWPPSLGTDRACNKTVELIDSHGRKLTINTGDPVFIPIYALHRDPKFFPNPNKFDPERFSDENKDSINPFAFQPFGLGPRACIGNRFAIMECKIFFFYILSKLKIEPNAKTEIPIKIKMGAFNILPANGMWLQFKARE